MGEWGLDILPHLQILIHTVQAPDWTQTNPAVDWAAVTVINIWSDFKIKPHLTIQKITCDM